MEITQWLLFASGWLREIIRERVVDYDAANCRKGTRPESGECEMPAVATEKQEPLPLVRFAFTQGGEDADVIKIKTVVSVQLRVAELQHELFIRAGRRLLGPFDGPSKFCIGRSIDPVKLVRSDFLDFLLEPLKHRNT